MSENNRVKISSVVNNQLPDYVRGNFPLAGEFLQQYYTAIENQGSTLDILQNIDKYIKIDELTNLVDSTTLSDNVGITNSTINVKSTTGFPNTYGLIQIDNEIITYTGITTNSFTGCARGFSGITSYRNVNKPDELVFSESGISLHSSGAVVNNLSIRFLQEFFKKVKKQITPGFEERALSDDIDKRLFIKQSKDFYSSKGTDQSFEILFRALYGEDVDIIKPRDFLFIPSNSDYKISKQIVVEAIEGDPLDLINRNLFQDPVAGLPKATAAISDIERIVRDEKEYYRLSLDYDKQSGRLFDDFSIHPNTKLVGSVSVGSTVLTVDSTVGFGTTGTLVAKYLTNKSSTIKYTSKSLNQFYGCTGVNVNLNSKQDIKLDAFAYGYSGLGTANVVKVRVTGVLGNLDLDFNVANYNEIGDVIEPRGLGINSADLITKSLQPNVSITYDVASFDLVDSSNFTYQLNLFDPHSFIIGDRALINDVECTIIGLISSKEVLVKGAGELSANVDYKIQRLISKANLSNYPDANIFTTNVQNSYIDDDEEYTCVYIASSSIPDYLDEGLDIRQTDLPFTGAFAESTNITIPNHGLISGEKVRFVSGGGSLDIKEEEYFVKKVDIDTIKIARSSSNVDNDIFVSFSGGGTNNKFKLAKFANKSIQSQKLLRKIKLPISSISETTVPGKIGILVNGVEILNYKSSDIIHYGSLSEIDVTSGGKNYDIINPPILTLSDKTGIGCSAICEVEGNIERIDVVDGGFDYLTTPTLKIDGGNGKGCVAFANLKLIDHSVEFDSTQLGGLVNITDNIIGFSTFHKFKDGELVIYNPEGQTAIAGLTTGAAYYCCVKSATTVTLHKKYDDSIDGFSPVDLTGYGAGIHQFDCNSQKRIISSVSVASSGIGYRNRLTTVTSSGINTSNNIINIKDHGYSNGDKIRYDTKSTTPISGLSTQTDYFVSKIDSGSFRLSEVGIGSTAQNFYLQNKEYINLFSGGTGIHEFNYPPITITVDGNIGVSTFSGQNFNATLRPIARGSIKSVYIPYGGVGYGSSEIINYNRQPEFTLNKGKDAQLIPIVSHDGKIKSVVIKNQGSGYNSPPELVVNGNGKGTVLVPILKSGTIDSVVVSHTGIGYSSSRTNITVTPNGDGANLYSKPKTWTINSVERLIQNNQITSDDGVVSEGSRDEYGLEYSHLYVPRKLRQSVNVKKDLGDKEVFVPDLRLEGDIEQDSINHSPIIGWSYDGSPIYGPYGYSDNGGGEVKILKSGYSVSISSERPNPLTSAGEEIYEKGFFVEDYVYEEGNELDQHNGRFCKTPDYPNGVYAYFANINPDVRDSEGAFKNYRRPQFPYFIGNSYKSKSIDYNFSFNSNQDDIDINNTGLIRNTSVYNFLFNKSVYDFLVDPNSIKKQKTFITSTSTGSVSKSVGIKTGGDNYKVNDVIEFDNSETSGSGIRAAVKDIKGKTITDISLSNTTFENVEFVPHGKPGEIVGYTTSPHNLFLSEYLTISGLSTNGFTNNQTVTAGVTTNRFSLDVGISSAGATGLVTFFNVNGRISDTFKVRPNDVLGIGTEQVKVLNVDLYDSRLRVLRNHNSTIGSAHTATSNLETKPRNFIFKNNTSNIGKNLTYNRELYFNPADSIALGTSFGVGIGSTVVFSNPGTGISEIFIPTKSIYFRDHGLKLGDQLTYKTNDGTALGVSTDGTMTFTLSNDQTLFAAPISRDLIGIATARVGLGATGVFIGINSTTNISTLFFTGIGTGVKHSFKTNYNNVLSGTVTRTLATVSTASTHGLKDDDVVNLSVLSGVTTTINVAYNDFNRRLVINPRTYIKAGINTSDNTINISDHGYISGQKVISTATTSPGGLVDNGIYYVAVVDKDKIKLCNQYYQSLKVIPDTINITSAQDGTISPINPKIVTQKNQEIKFDLSDSSLSFSDNEVLYSAFDFALYNDKLLTNRFYSSSLTDTFNLTSSGKIGIDTTANVTIKNVEQISKVLYYNLIPINGTLNKIVKQEIVTDNLNINNYNTLDLKINPLNFSYPVVSVGTTTFSFSAIKPSPKLQYNETDGDFSYTTTSNNVYGPINSVNVINVGHGYRSLPGITTITSDLGNGAILELFGSDVGRILDVDIQDIGFDYSSDRSLKPESQIPQLIKVDALESLKKIGITSSGNNYLESPGLVVLDGTTQKEVDVDLDYELGDEEVTILKNTKSLNNVTPIILPTSNSNGIKISGMDFDYGTKLVTVTIGATFTTLADFPFEIGKKVMIEGVSVGVGTTGIGYNSASYDYRLFKVLSTDANIGGAAGSISYSLSGIIPEGKIAGTFKPASSAGRIIKEEDFPIFDISLKGNKFDIGETIVSHKAVGVLQSFNTTNSFLKISSPQDYEVGDTVTGESSGVKGTITQVVGYRSFYDVESSSIVKEGWQDDSGFLNTDNQRLFDSDYYQYFSYGIKSEVPFEKWENAVSSLNHTAGFKQFSDLVIREEISVGINTIQTESNFDIVTDLVSIMDMNSVFDFDLVREKTLRIDDKVISDQVIFESRRIKDFTSSIGNRVLNIDDVSPTFNNTERIDKFSAVDIFELPSTRSRKYITFVRDRRFTKERQVMLVSLIHNNKGNMLLNQYGTIATNTDGGEFTSELGSFDLDISGENGRLLFFPKKFQVNNYDVTSIAYNISDSVAGIGSTDLGSICEIVSGTTEIPLGISTSHSIVSLASTYRAAKILVSYAATDKSYFEYEELTMIHNGSEIDLMEYGQLTSDNLGSGSGTPGLGTYSASFVGSRISIDVHPNVATATSYVANTLSIDVATHAVSGIGTTTLQTGLFGSRRTSISSSGSPSATTVATYDNESYSAAYYLAVVTNTTDSHYAVSELIVIDDGTTSYLTEYGNVETSAPIGTFDAEVDETDTNITFTPIANKNVVVQVYQNAIGIKDDDNTEVQIDLENASIDSGEGTYSGTGADIARAFELTHRQNPIFKRNFVGGASTVVSALRDTVRIPDHYFVTGEELTYRYLGAGTTSAIGISTQTISGYGSTDKLPDKVYAIKVNDSTLKLASTAQNALKTVPIHLDISAVGVGTSHSFTSKKQNSRCIISIDNVIQQPIVATSVTTVLSAAADSAADKIKISGITSVTGGDLLKIDDEIMKVNSVGVGDTNILLVSRPWMGSALTAHTSGSLVTKIEGNYNIVDNTINFYAAPAGLVPLSTSSNEPDETDFVGIATHSTFNGRSFMRSGIKDTTVEPYSKNYIFDDVSANFTGLTTEFTLKQDGSNVAGFSTSNAIVLVNQVFQSPKRTGDEVTVTGDFTLIEDTDAVGVTTIQFTGSTSSVASDPNTANVPLGGIIVSVGSTEGFGYQPLVAAGGTAVVSGLGTISSISIGNSGSGYRPGVQSVVNVGVQTLSTGVPAIEFIGTAAISNGNIVSVAVTNPGTGYTSTNPPLVVIDEPLSYDNMPLFYTSSSSGVGSEATANIVVGQGSSVIDFQIIKEGYGYGDSGVLTVGVGGSVGIPTTVDYSPSRQFELTIQETISDTFAAWTVGDFQVFDPLDSLFDGQTLAFALKIDDEQQTINTEVGSPIDVEYTLLVFINNILQVPQIGYEFKGGSYLTFKEAPKSGDTSKILFYKGTGSVDTSLVDVLETVKKGDELRLYDDNIEFEQGPRIVTAVNAADNATTNPYDSVGINTDETFERSITWSRQLTDKVIDGNEVTKDRPHYEPLIYPTSNIISPVSASSTIAYVESARTFFDNSYENYDGQGTVQIISQDDLVGAAATAIVSGFGTISSFVISNSGMGYTGTADVSIEQPVGFGTTQRATATAAMDSDILESISLDSVGSGYTTASPPAVLIGAPQASSAVEKVTSVTYSGDFGTVVGFGTTTVGGRNRMIFDMHIPLNSPLRDTTITGTAVTLSSLTVNDFFIVNNSNVGNANTSLKSFNTNGITTTGICTQFVDNVYQVVDANTVSIANTVIGLSTVGAATTYIRRVFVNIDKFTSDSFDSSILKFDSTSTKFDSSGIGVTYSGNIYHQPFFGEYSFGKVGLGVRAEPRSFKFYGDGGTGGISTSAYIQRFNPLRYTEYD